MPLFKYKYQAIILQTGFSSVSFREAECVLGAMA